MSIIDKVIKDTDYSDMYSAVAEALSLAEVARILGFTLHSRDKLRFRDYIVNVLKCDVTHFTYNGRPPSVYEVRVCPQCNSNFTVCITEDKSSKQITCSRACSNKFFKQNKKPLSELKHTNYQERAKRAGLTACCICGISEVLDIHHVDHDKTNNSIGNLVALCPNHHALLHRTDSNELFYKLIEHIDTRVLLDTYYD